MRAVNLLPPDTRGASKVSADLGAGPEAKGGAGPFVVLGVLAVCVAGAAGYVLTDNTVKQRSADLAEVTVNQRALQSRANQLKPYADYDSMAKARVQTVRDLATSRFDWEQALRDLSRAVPNDVALASLTGDTSTASGTGSAVRSAISGPAITITGCAAGQTQVARLMARLRDIDGVTRVSLAKSAAAEVSTSETATDDASVAVSAEELRGQRNATPCGAGKKSSSFEMVMFFENDAAAVAATPATASGAAAATPTPTATATATPGTSAASTPSTTTTQQGATP